MSSRVLVTGGAGFIGSHVVEVLCRAGRPVVVLDDLSSGSRDNLVALEAAGSHFDFVEGSVADPGAVARAMAGVDKVVHLAALPSVARSVERPLDTHHACATGTVLVLEAARRQGARVVYAGSSSAYGDQAAAQKGEDLREDPRSPYAAGKLAGELYCRAYARVYGLRVVVARLFNVFGPRQPSLSPYAGVVAAFCGALLRGEPARVDGDGLQTRDFTYVGDVADGLVRCLDADTAGCVTVNLAQGQATTVLDLYRRLRQLAAGAADQEPAAPCFGPPRTGDIRNSQADVARARAMFGFDPRIGLVEGLRLTFEWYRTTSGRSAIR